MDITHTERYSTGRFPMGMGWKGMEVGEVAGGGGGGEGGGVRPIRISQDRRTFKRISYMLCWFPLL